MTRKRGESNSIYVPWNWSVLPSDAPAGCLEQISPWGGSDDKNERLEVASRDDISMYLSVSYNTRN